MVKSKHKFHVSVVYLPGDQIHKGLHDGEPFTTWTSERVTQNIPCGIRKCSAPGEPLQKLLSFKPVGPLNITNIIMPTFWRRQMV